jgi:hypothetical protein
MTAIDPKRKLGVELPTAAMHPDTGHCRSPRSASSPTRCADRIALIGEVRIARAAIRRPPVQTKALSIAIHAAALRGTRRASARRVRRSIMFRFCSIERKGRSRSEVH